MNVSASVLYRAISVRLGLVQTIEVAVRKTAFALTKATQKAPGGEPVAVPIRINHYAKEPGGKDEPYCCRRSPTHGRPIPGQGDCEVTSLFVVPVTWGLIALTNQLGTCLETAGEWHQPVGRQIG